MSEVSNLLDSKGHNVLTAKPEQVVQDVITRMARIGAGTCVVMEEGQVVGIMSERDVIKKIVLDERSAVNVKVSEIMTTLLHTVTPETSLDECMRIMTEKRLRHLPVLRDAQLCGIISIGDVVKYLLIEKDFKIKNLETVLNQSK